MARTKAAVYVFVLGFIAFCKGSDRLAFRLVALHLQP